MSAHSQSFRSLLERISLPYVLITGAATSLANIDKVIAQTGFRYLAASTIFVAILWTYHVWSEKTESRVLPGTFVPTHSRLTRLLAIVVVVASCVPLWLAFRSQSQFQLPTVGITIWNDHVNELSVRALGEFYVTASLTPAHANRLASGKIQLGNGRDPVYVGPKKSTSIDSTLLAAPLYEEFYRRGDLDIFFVLYTVDGQMLRSETIPFRHDWLIGEVIVFFARPSGG